MSRGYDVCAYVLDGHDTDDTPWYRCTVHDELAPSYDAPCAGSTEPAYSSGLEDDDTNNVVGNHIAPDEAQR